MISPRSRHVYQFRVGPDECASDMVGEATNVVCKVLRHYTDPPGLLDWPEVYLAFSTVIRKRLVRYENCGKRDACRALLRPALWGVPDGGLYFWDRQELAYLPDGTLTLELRQDLDGFIRGLAALVCRRLKKRLRPVGARRALMSHLRVAIQRALSPYAFHAACCASCGAKGGRERFSW